MNNMELGLWGQGRWWNTRFWHSNQQAAMNDMSDGVRAVFSRSTDRLDTIAENLSNASTPGFRSGCVMPRNFVGELHGRLIGHQWRVGTDLSQGSIRMTDRPLDFAMEGEGFFVVRSGQGDFLTRNGSFEITPDGTLISAAGYEVLGDNNQPLQVPDGVALDRLAVSEDGVLSADGEEIGQFRLERVSAESELKRVGTTMFSAASEARLPAENARVIGRALEGSNTTVYQELADMMVLSRSVEAAQRAQSSEAEAQKKMMEALS